MKNFEKYKTIEECYAAHSNWCNANTDNSVCRNPHEDVRGNCLKCAFKWMFLEAEEEKPMPCPFCGGNVVKESGKLKCNAPLCGYSLMLDRDPDNTVAAHNRVCRAVKEANA